MHAGIGRIRYPNIAGTAARAPRDSGSAAMLSSAPSVAQSGSAVAAASELTGSR
jgi:hypothetical protein